MHTAISLLSCDPLYRAMVRDYYRTGDAYLLEIISDYREERGLRRLGKGLARPEDYRGGRLLARRMAAHPAFVAARRAVRVASGQPGSSYPIVIVEGDAAPELQGTRWHYENASGDWIRHPSAYRRAWGKPIYVSSTLQIEVGREWLAEQGIAADGL